jgi:hypothetical protein
VSKKITVPLKGLLVGKEHVPAKCETEYEGKKYAAKPESYVAYFLVGNGIESRFLSTQPNIMTAKLIKSSYEKLKEMTLFDCEAEFEYDRFKVISVKGLELEPDAVK